MADDRHEDGKPNPHSLARIPHEEIPAEDFDRDPEVISPGMYFDRTKDEGDVPAGSLVLVTDVNEESVWFTHEGRGFRQPVDGFLEVSIAAPDGRERREQEILRIMRDLNDSQKVGAELLSRSPRIASSTSASDTEGNLPVLWSQDAESLKREVATIRNDIAKHEQKVDLMRARLNALLEEQKVTLMASTRAAERMLKRMEEMVWTLNLYLGQQETIVQLVKGEPAPAEEPITIRQLVLYADEECAISAEEGGIDIRNFEAFDEWIKEPRHRQQVLPDERGVVAFKIRRNSKEYGDPWANVALNKENFSTYFLMRNGENLYRIQTDLEVGKTLTPKEDEFESMFWEQDYSSGGSKPLRPGTDAYAKAMEKAGNRERHYQRIVLFLQGLLDRTTIFQPLPSRQINIVDIRGQERYLRHIADAEESRMLGVNRPDFKTWQRGLNDRIEVGHRVIGMFGDYVHGLAGLGKYESRVSPRGAGYPKNNAIYTIERKDPDGALVLFFDRMVWDSYHYEERVSERRASCRVYPSDQFILNFDLATVEDMRFYLQSRINRHEYQFIFPVLKQAIRMKQAEEEEEAPFRKLLLGEILKEYGVESAEAAPLLGDLVAWWKFNNRIRRALLSDDSKAIRMITREYGLRRQAESERKKVDLEGTAKRILAKRQDAVFVGFKKDSEFVCLVPENEENLFVTEETWRLNRHGELTLKDSRPWRTIDGRRNRWHPLYSSPRLDEWRFDVRPGSFLTDPEVEEIMGQAWELAKQTLDHHREWYRNIIGEPCYFPLAAVIDEEHNVSLFLHDGHRKGSLENPLSQPVTDPSFARITVPWKRTTGGKLKIERGKYSNLSYFNPTRPTESRYGHGGEGKVRILWSDPGAITRIEAELAEKKEIARARSNLEIRISQLASQVQKRMMADQEAIAYGEFLRDYGDPSLWEGHRKALKLREPRVPNQVHVALEKLVQAGATIDGRTLGEILSGVDPVEQDDQVTLPLDLVLREKKDE